MEELDEIGIAKRLRAVMAHLDIETVKEFGEMLGAERSAVSNWLNAATSGNPPRVHYMTKLISKLPGLTLDWIYTGNADAIPMGLAVRLIALADLEQVPEQKAPVAEKVVPAAKARPDPGARNARRQRDRQAT